MQTRTEHDCPPAAETDLERRVLHGLACEWQAARDELSDADARQLRPPLFRLAALKRTWGLWYAARGEIVISKRLVHHHPWDAVREVLHHEMAHQLADHLLSGGSEPPHGPCFHHACRLLKANPRASGRYPPLDDRLQDPTADPQDRLMVKIRKLLALAASPHPQEAQAAMLKARELTDRHNLALLESVRPAAFLSIFLSRPALRHSREVYHLAHLILNHYWVAGLWIPAYVVEKGKMGRVLEISGTRANVQSAAYVYDYISHYIHSQWRAYTQKRKLNHQRRIDFAVGIIQGFQGKLDGALCGPAPAGAQALVARADPHLAAYMTRRYPRTRNVYRNVRQADARVMADGIEKGRQLVIARGVESRNQNGPKAILPAS